MESKYNFKELMKARHSCRKFQSKPIPEEVLKDIISISLHAPSWCNSQPWNIYVASGQTLEEIRKEWISKSESNIKGYADINPGHRTDFSEKSQAIMAKFYKCWDDFPPKDAAECNPHIFNAPTMVYLTVNKGHTEYAVLDLGGLEMAIMLAAKDHGVDSIPAYTTIMYPDVLRKYLKISDKEDIVIGIALGYEEKCKINEHRSVKMTLDEACHFFN